MFQLVCVQNGQYGVVHKDNEKMICDQPFQTREEAVAAGAKRFRMLQSTPNRWETLEGTYEDFTVTVKNTDKADFSDHYFIEEV